MHAAVEKLEATWAERWSESWDTVFASWLAPLGSLAGAILVLAVAALVLARLLAFLAPMWSGVTSQHLINRVKGWGPSLILGGSAAVALAVSLSRHGRQVDAAVINRADLGLSAPGGGGGSVDLDKFVAAFALIALSANYTDVDGLAARHPGGPWACTSWPPPNSVITVQNLVAIGGHAPDPVTGPDESRARDRALQLVRLIDSRSGEQGDKHNEPERARGELHLLEQKMRLVAATGYVALGGSPDLLEIGSRLTEAVISASPWVRYDLGRVYHTQSEEQTNPTRKEELRELALEHLEYAMIAPRPRSFVWKDPMLARTNRSSCTLAQLLQH